VVRERGRDDHESLEPASHGSSIHLACLAARWPAGSWQYGRVAQNAANVIERVMWQPWLPLALLGYFLYRCITSGVSAYRLIAVVWMAIWLAMTLYNWRTGGRLLRFIRSSDE
jgi:hypothetical protein